MTLIQGTVENLDIDIN